MEKQIIKPERGDIYKGDGLIWPPGKWWPIGDGGSASIWPENDDDG